MHPAGFYKTDRRALRLCELIRLHGLLRLPFVFFSRFKVRYIPGGWMPGLWAESECRREELSDAFWRNTESARAGFRRLGFEECGFAKLTRHLNPALRDNGGIRYWDGERSCIGLLLYTRFQRPPPLNLERLQLIVAMTVFFKDGRLSCTDYRGAYDSTPKDKVFRMASADPAEIYRRLRHEASRQPEPPRQFPDLDSLRGAFDEMQMEAFQERVNRGLFVRMGDDEVAAARRAMPPPLPSVFP